MGISRVFPRLSKNVVLITGILLLSLAVACSSSSDGGSASSGSQLVPQRANLVGTVATGQKMDAIDMDQFFEMFSSGLPGDEKGFNKFFSVDQLRDGEIFGDVNRADIFGEMTDADDLDYFGALLHGSFDESKLIAELETLSGRKLVKRGYKGTNIYSPEDDADEYDLSILDGSTFAVGTGGAINDIIDIKAGDVNSASGPLIDTFSGLSDGLFGLALKVPQDLADGADLDAIPGLGDLPISLDFISSLDIVGLSGDLNGGSLDVAVTMDFTDEEAAESLEGFIGGIVSLASGFLTDSSTAGLLADLEIDRDGSRLIMKIAIPVADIPDLFGDLDSITGSESSTDSASISPPGTTDIRILPIEVGVEVPSQGSDHVDEGVRVDYNSTPPTSGEHWPRWADCGFYSKSLPDERIVHNLEHGNIVVSYNFANPAQVTELREALEGVAQFGSYGVARPYDDIADGKVALSAWGRLHIMDGVVPIDISRFFDSFAGNLGPERVAC